MSRSSGTYTAPSNSWNPAVEGTPVDETDWNAVLDDIETALTESVYTGGLGSTDNRLVRTDGTDTKKAQGSAVTVDDSGNMSGVGTLASGAITSTGAVTGTALSASTSGVTTTGTIELGHATDTTIARSGAGDITIEGNAVYRAGGTDVALADGGTGTSLTDPGADRIMAWDDTAGTVKFMPLADLTAEAAPATGDVVLIYGAEGDLRAVDWGDLPGAGIGSGDVVGPASATDNAIARFDGTGGKTLQNSGVTVDDSNNVTGIAALTIAGAMQGATNLFLPCDGRLTLTSGTAVTTSDVTGATTIYFTPYKGNRIALYSGSAWVYRTFSEISLALGTISDATNYDVFIYDNSGTVAIDSLVAWTNATTRATAITLQDGVYVKSGATTRRYVGTIRTTATTTTEDSLAKRFVWNMYNRVPRPMRVWDTTDTWTYSTATWRQANASTANQLAVVRGVNEDAASASVSANVVNSTSSVRYVRVAVGLDSTTAPASDSNVSSGACTDTITPALLCNYSGLPGLGYHYMAWLEKGHGADTQTWRGDAGQTDLNLGINGTVMA